VVNRNKGHALIVNIESVPAIEALDDILDVPDLDAVLVGPHDLSCSLGVPEQYDHPLFDEAMMTIITKARAKNIGVGAHNLPKIEQDVRYAKAGMNLILRLIDMTLFRRGLNEDLGKIRQALGDEAAAELGDVIN
jgi:4-hydroxy-2-oxoheptanedioate aldolase